MRFHTGEAVNADDIIATYHTLIEFGHPAYAQRFSDIARVEKIDNLTVRFYANPDFKHDMPFNIASLPVLSAQDLLQRDFTQTTATAYWHWAYQIVDHKVGHSVTFSRDVHYWGQSLPINQGRHNFDTIHYKYFRDENVALTAFKAGRYDWRMENVAKFWATQYTGDQFTNGLIKKKCKSTASNLMACKRSL